MDCRRTWSGLMATNLSLVIVATCLSMVLTLTRVGNPVLWTASAVPLVCVLPGYAVIAAVFPRGALNGVERVLLSLGLSQAITALSGLLLNKTSWGLQARSWSIFLGVVTLCACAVAILRHHAQPVGVPNLLRSSLSARQAVILGLAAITLCGAIIVAYVGAAQQPTPGFTQLWVLPAAPSDRHYVIVLGIKNMESTDVTYQLKITVHGKEVEDLLSIKLAPNQTWDTTSQLPTSPPAIVPVDATLYRTDAPDTVYRHVVIWLGR